MCSHSCKIALCIRTIRPMALPCCGLRDRLTCALVSFVFYQFVVFNFTFLLNSRSHQACARRTASQVLVQGALSTWSSGQGSCELPEVTQILCAECAEASPPQAAEEEVRLPPSKYGLSLHFNDNILFIDTCSARSKRPNSSKPPLSTGWKPVCRSAARATTCSTC